MNKRFYHPELDALRFAAFLAVFVHHAFGWEAAAFPSLGAFAPLLAIVTETGGYGVDLFFCLSAYLITTLLLREHAATGRIDTPAFYLRRSLRIWPLYFVFLLLSTALIPWLIPHATLSRHALLSFATFTGNWYGVAHDGLPPSPIAPLWSVSIEEQFYLAWPLLVLLVQPRRLPWLAGTMLVVATAVRVMLVAHNAGPNAFWLNTFTRLDALAIGILIAVWLPQPLALPWRWRLLAITGAVTAMLLVTAMTERSGLGVLISYPLVASASGLIVIAMLHPAAQVPRLITYFGKISYGLYVFHVLAIELAKLCGIPFLLLPITALALTIGFAVLSYQWLERPFLRIKDRLTVVPSRPT